MQSDVLKSILQQQSLARAKKALILLYAQGSNPCRPAEIVKTGLRLGLRDVRKWNLSSVLQRTRGLAVRVPDGWELTLQGRKQVEALLGQISPSASANVRTSLRSHLSSLGNATTRAFVQEAIECLEQGHYRASVVLSWAGAISVLYDHVLGGRLSDFNAEARRRNAKWHTAKTADDLATMKEKDFLDVLQTTSVLGKNVKVELQNSCLSLRNGCAHPNTLVIDEHRVTSHLEILMLNVFSKF